MGLEWCFEKVALKHHVVDFFNGPYTLDYSIVEVFPCNVRLDRLPQDAIRILCFEVTNDEIQRAMFGMVLLKALGVDGFEAIFFQSKWEVVGPSICSFSR